MQRQLTKQQKIIWNKLKKQYLVMTYDIETTQIIGSLFRPGQQFFTHKQLLNGYFSRTHIICITYKWAHEKKARILTWGKDEKDEKKMLEEFDKLVSKADLVIGKNSDSFDNKHINTQRLWHTLPAMTDWTKYTGDLERQMRKHLNLPSFSLDYFSQQLGLGGKISMQWSDWEDINQLRFLTLTKCKSDIVTETLFARSVSDIIKAGEAAQKRMFTYGMKDTVDTETLLKYCVEYVDNIVNMSVTNDKFLVKRCPKCGSSKLKESETKRHRTAVFQTYYCENHHGYAGRSRVNKTGVSPIIN